MHRFFVPSVTFDRAPAVSLGGDLAHQLARVLRLRSGERVVLLDGRGEEWVVRLTAVAPERVEGEIEARRVGGGEPGLHLRLYQALLKGDHLDYVLQKGTEVGIAAFAPVLTERTIARGVDARKLARWERIVREAAEQSGRARVPTVAEPLPLAAVPNCLVGTPAFALWEGERAVGLGAALGALRPFPTRLALIVGPEGGLSEAEVADLRAAGIASVTLGPRILRAETAGLVAASALLYAAGDLGGRPPTSPNSDASGELVLRGAG
jgi:16S rRNA (uracil1498-N3)-methyltransferase